MLDFFKKIFGTKHDRDVRTYRPIVDKINAFAEEYKNLSNDELRNNTLRFRERIAKHLEGIDKDINRLKDEVSTEQDLGSKEYLYDQIDELTKERDTHLEVILRALLPDLQLLKKQHADSAITKYWK